MFVPMSIVATRTSLDVAEVQHLFHVRLDDQLDAAVLLRSLLRLLRRPCPRSGRTRRSRPPPSAAGSGRRRVVALRLLRVAGFASSTRKSVTWRARIKERPQLSLNGPPGGYFTLSV